MEINQNLKKIRNQNKITQKELAEKSGVPYANYNKYETTTTIPDIETLIKLANFYNISLDYLVGRKFGNDIGFLTDDQFQNLKIILSLSEKNQYKVFGYALSLLQNQN